MKKIDEKILSLEDFEKTKTEVNAPTRTKIEEDIAMKLRKDWEELPETFKEQIIFYIEKEGFGNIEEWFKHRAGILFEDSIIGSYEKY